MNITSIKFYEINLSILYLWFIIKLIAILISSNSLLIAQPNLAIDNDIIIQQDLNIDDGEIPNKQPLVAIDNDIIIQQDLNIDDGQILNQQRLEIEEYNE